MSDSGPNYSPIVSGDSTYRRSELGGHYVSEGGSYLTDEQALRIRADQLEAELISTGSKAKNASPSTPVDFSGFGRFMVGAAKVALMVGLPVAGLMFAKGLWDQHQTNAYPDLSVVTDGGRYYSGAGATPAIAHQNAVAACRSQGSTRCNEVSTVTSTAAFCIAVTQNAKSGLHIHETVTNPRTDRLRNARERVITEFETTGTMGNQELTEVQYFCNTARMAKKFEESAAFQKELTERAKIKQAAVYEARTDIKAIEPGPYSPKTAQINLLDGPSGNLRVRMHLNRGECIRVVNGEQGFANARVMVNPYGGDRLIGGLVNKQDIVPAPECASQVARMAEIAGQTEAARGARAGGAAGGTSPSLPQTQPRSADASSTPTRTTFAPSDLPFDQQLEYYGFSGNGKEPRLEGRIALNAGPLMANADGSFNGKVRYPMNINARTCVLTVNFGEANILNSQPVYVPVRASGGGTALTGGWYKGRLGEPCTP